MCRPYGEILGNQREALSASSAQVVGETMAIIKQRLHATLAHLAAEGEVPDHVDYGGTHSLGGCMCGAR